MLSHSTFLWHAQEWIPNVGILLASMGGGMGTEEALVVAVFQGLAYLVPFCNKVVHRVGQMLGGEELGERQMRPQIVFPCP